MKHMEHGIKIFISKFSQHWLHSLHYKWKNTGFTFNSKTKTLNVFIVLWALLKEILKWHETLNIPNKLTFLTATLKFDPNEVQTPHSADFPRRTGLPSVACTATLACPRRAGLPSLRWHSCLAREKSLKPLKKFKIQLIITTTVIPITVSK